MYQYIFFLRCSRVPFGFLPCIILLPILKGGSRISILYLSGTYRTIFACLHNFLQSFVGFGWKHFCFTSSGVSLLVLAAEMLTFIAQQTRMIDCRFIYLWLHNYPYNIHLHLHLLLLDLQLMTILYYSLCLGMYGSSLYREVLEMPSLRFLLWLWQTFFWMLKNATDDRSFILLILYRSVIVVVVIGVQS